MAEVGRALRQTPIGFAHPVSEALPQAICGDVQGLQPQKIVLFGSYATGTATPNSAVELPASVDSSASYLERYLAVSRLLAPRPFPVDIIGSRIVLVTPSRKERSAMQTIIPFLWLDDQAEEATAFYTAIFQNSRVGNITRYGSEGPGRPGQIMTVAFQLAGQDFMALNGGPHFSFTPAISFFVTCATQAEVDYFWDRLSEGGEQGKCGWLKDKFGVSWQIVPSALGEMMGSSDAARTRRVTQAMLRMQKLEIEGLRHAYEQD